MNIKIKFITKRTPDWEKRIIENAEIASKILSDQKFWDEIGPNRTFDLTEQSGRMIAELFMSSGDVEIRVGFYSQYFTKAFAYEENGDIFFNTRKWRAGSPGNIAHEICHAIGFKHKGNAAAGNQNTVPYFIGNAVEKWARK